MIGGALALVGLVAVAIAGLEWLCRALPALPDGETLGIGATTVEDLESVGQPSLVQSLRDNGL